MPSAILPLLFSFLLLSLPPSCIATPSSSSSLPFRSERPLLPSSVRQIRPRPCGDFCKFRFCNFNGTIFGLPVAPFLVLPNPKIATSPFICSLKEEVQTITQTGEARVFEDDVFVPISAWRPPGLALPFPSDTLAAFKAIHLPFSGVGRPRPSKQGQWGLLHDRCVLLPVLQYKVKRRRKVVDVDTSGEQNACVAFRITAPELHLQLLWDTGDDFDVLVEEPGGAIVDLVSPVSESGRLLGDTNNMLCDSELPGGREDIVYFPGRAERGVYAAEVRHGVNCTERDTRYNLKVIKKGNLFQDWNGISKAGVNTLVLNRTFRF